MLRSPLRSIFVPVLGSLALTPVHRAIALLRSLGTSAHVWLPGANGVNVASLPSNNYLLSDFATYSGADVVGGVKDAMNPSGGISLTQATTANKPLVRRGMLNLLLRSATLTNASWVKAGPVVTGANNKVALPATPSGYNIVWQSLTLVANAPHTMAVTLRGDVGGEVVWIFWTQDEVNYSRTQCTLTTTEQTFVLAFTPTTTLLNYVGIGIDLRDSSQSAKPAETFYVGNTLVAPGTWTAAQILAEGGIPTTTATAASNPSAGKYWWSFDGSNDSLLSGNLGITNACTIVIAGRVNSLAATQVLAQEANSGVQLFLATDGTYYFYKEGVAMLVASAAGAVTAGVPFVLTARLSGGTAVIRLNGVQVATAATAQVLSATTGMRIGRNFADTSYALNGAIGWVVPLPVALSDADCLTVERLVSSQFPNGPVF